MVVDNEIFWKLIRRFKAWTFLQINWLMSCVFVNHTF